MNKLINIFIEIEKNSNIRHKYNKEQNKLIVKRIINPPYVYPYSCGFIQYTCNELGNEIDAIIISETDNIRQNTKYEAYIIGALIIENEIGMTEKILCVPESEYQFIKDIKDLNNDIKNKIYTFYENYKQNNFKKWSKVIGFINKDISIKLYNNSIIKYYELNGIVKDDNCENNLNELYNIINNNYSQNIKTYNDNLNVINHNKNNDNISESSYSSSSEDDDYDSMGKSSYSSSSEDDDYDSMGKSSYSSSNEDNDNDDDSMSKSSYLSSSEDDDEDSMRKSSY